MREAIEEGLLKTPEEEWYGTPAIDPRSPRYERAQAADTTFDPVVGAPPVPAQT